MKCFIVAVAFTLLATVYANPSPFFHHHFHGGVHTYHPVAVREYVRVPEVHVQKVVHTVPVYVPVVKPVVHQVPVVVHSVPVTVPVAVPAERPVNVEVGGGVNVAANPGAVHVTKTKPVKVSV